MRILVISHEFPPIGGGGANACNYLIKGLAKEGNEIVLITSNINYELPEREYLKNIEIIRVNSYRKYKEHCSFKEMLSYLLKAWPVARSYVQKYKFDICQIFFGIPSGPIGYLLKKKYGLPYVIRFGGGDIPGFQERFKYVYLFLSPFIKLIWNNANYLIANSEGLKKLADNFYSVKNINIIPNGVDAEYYCSINRVERNDSYNILFVSRLIERKGLQYIIPVLNEVNKLIDKQVHMTVVGDGPYKEVLKELVKKYGVGQLATFVGYKNKEEILRYYQDADVFILPSKKEGMPNVVLEAMACGLPIVMTPCEGSKELINENGYVVDVNGFKECLVRLGNDENLRKNMGSISRNISYTLFGWNKVVNQYIKCYESVISENN